VGGQGLLAVREHGFLRSEGAIATWVPARSMTSLLVRSRVLNPLRPRMQHDNRGCSRGGTRPAWRGMAP